LPWPVPDYSSSPSYDLGERSWYYVTAGEVWGPVRGAWLAQAIETGALSTEVLVWSAPLERWTPASEVEAFASAVEACPRQVPEQEARLAELPDIPGEEPENATRQVRPWVRWWARGFDYGAAYAMPALLLLTVAGPHLWPEMWLRLVELNSFAVRVVFTIVVLVLGIGFESSLLSSWGTTPGKWLLGTRLRHASGRKLTHREALTRALRVLYRGQALSIPPLSFIANYVAYTRLSERGSTTWDDQGACLVIHRRIGALRIVGFVLFGLLLGPDYAGLHEVASSTTAEALTARGDHERAATAWARAVELNPNDTLYWWHLAQAQRNAGRPGEAIDALKRGGRLAPRDRDFPELLARFYLQTGQYDASLGEARKLVELAPEWAPSHARLGDALLWGARPREAVESYREALSHNAKLLRARSTLALALLLDDDPAAALEEYKRLAESRPQPAYYERFFHNLALRRASRPDDARRMLKDLSLPEAPWERSLLDYLTDEISADELTARAESAEQISEAHFYVGYRAWVEGDDRAAQVHLERTIAAGVYNFFEYASALVLIRRLERAQ
jgi:tetratricopeptide (TPR) repeat protein